MTEQQATKTFLKMILTDLQGEGVAIGDIEEVVEQMHNDENFFSELKVFLQEHLDDFGENYGL